MLVGCASSSPRWDSLRPPSLSPARILQGGMARAKPSHSSGLSNSATLRGMGDIRRGREGQGLAWTHRINLGKELWPPRMGCELASPTGGKSAGCGSKRSK